jgi:hypothetical protein
VVMYLCGRSIECVVMYLCVRGMRRVSGHAFVFLTHKYMTTHSSDTPNTQIHDHSLDTPTTQIHDHPLS